MAETALSIAREKAAARGMGAEFVAADALHLHRLASVTAHGGRLYVLCFSDVGPDAAGPHPISQEELRAPFASVSPDRIRTRFDAQGAPAWLAKIERI